MHKNSVNGSWMWFHFFPFAWNVKSVNDNFPHFSWFWVKKLLILEWFHMESLNWSEKWFHDMIKIFYEREFTDPTLRFMKLNILKLPFFGQWEVFVESKSRFLVHVWKSQFSIISLNKYSWLQKCLSFLHMVNPENNLLGKAKRS